jgi:hypothetical protein
VALARLRQLAAHETGHTLGFSHNFSGSTWGRASVMDYPAPRIELKNGKIDLSDAYGVGIGKWDMFTIDWLYGSVPSGAAGQAVLNAKAKAASAWGYRFVTDADARPLGSAQPYGSLWDDGADPAAELMRLMKVRRYAIDHFGLSALTPGEAVQDLKRKYVPIYLLHRYQLQATAKLVGGLDYPYAVAGDAKPAAIPVSQKEQRAALSALLATLKPGALDTPEHLLPLLSAGQSGAPDRQYEIEVMPTLGPAVFDRLAAADIASGMTIDALIAPDRLARLADQKSRDAKDLGARDALRALMHAVFPGRAAPGRLAAIQRRVQTRLALEMARTAQGPKTAPGVAALLQAQLSALAHRLKAVPGQGPVERAHRAWLAHILTHERELTRVLGEKSRTLPVPPGSPIGEGYMGPL